MSLRKAYLASVFLTFFQFVEPDIDNGLRVFSMMNEPQGQRLHTLLRVAKLGQLLF